MLKRKYFLVDIFILSAEKQPIKIVENRMIKTNYPDEGNKSLFHNMKLLSKEMKVSIIIPVYNVAPYVEECIQSVLRQDYKNLEIIIIDDCGTDNSMELVEELVKNSSRDIVILKHDYNKGLSAARNTGIRRATGDYIFFWTVMIL